MNYYCRDISYLLGERFLFRDLSVEFPNGNLIGVLGPNGVGKSTFLRLLAGIVSPIEPGLVYLDDRPLPNWPLREKAKSIAYLPQRTPIYSELSVLEIVLLGRAPYQNFFFTSKSSTKQDEEMAKESLQVVGLEGYEGRMIHSLSGGERQRVMLARLLCTQANIFILDEPITALDIRHALDFLELCQRLCRENKSIIILALHQLELAYRYCDLILLLGRKNKEDQRHWWYGETKKVMESQSLSDLFQIQVKKQDSHLCFENFA